MKKLKKIAVLILAILGVLFIILMLMPEDDELSGGEEEIETVPQVETNTVQSLEEVIAVDVGTDAKSATVMVYMNGSDLESESGEATADISEMVFIHSADDSLHFRRMTEDPRNSDSGFGNAVLFSKLTEDTVKFGKIRVIDKASLEGSEL